MFVHTDARRRGVGAAPVQAVIDHAAGWVEERRSRFISGLDLRPTASSRAR
jgi:GNAT superfamily N-acetyltransferase